MNRQQIVDYYSRNDIAERIANDAKNREVGAVFLNGSFDRRPNVIQYKNDVKEMAKNGISSFHLSVEHWKNPMSLRPDNYAELRSGFDIVIDIDSKLGIEEAQAAAVMICDLMKKYGIKNCGIKFSGSRGFHVCIPWSMLPKEIDYKKTEKLYPEIPRSVCGFVRKEISDGLLNEIKKRKSAQELLGVLNEKPEKMSPFYFVEVEKDWGSRHMFRAPYSLNEKTWLVSLPLGYSQLKSFSAGMAEPGKIHADSDFFGGEENEAEALVLDAMDWHASQKKYEPKKPVSVIKWERKVTENVFPPCMKNILSGLRDGRKRSIFTLINFLRMMNWSWHEIEKKIFEWNMKNTAPLQRNIILSQIRYQQQKESRPPANCFNDTYYMSIGVCRPDDTCKKIKNPAGYPFKKISRKIPAKMQPASYRCRCGETFPSEKSLNMHKGRVHGAE